MHVAFVQTRCMSLVNGCTLTCWLRTLPLLDHATVALVRPLVELSAMGKLWLMALL